MAFVKREARKPRINLDGPDGNAFVLIGKADSLGEQLGFSKEKIAEIRSEMMAGDYNALLKVFDREFGQYVDLEGGPGNLDDSESED